MIHLLLLLSVLDYPMTNEREIAEVVASALSTPRLQLTRDAAAGLSGRAFLSVAGPEGTIEVEPWIFVARMPWLFRAQGWEPRIIHNGLMSWQDARTALTAAAANRRPSIWVWMGEAGHGAWGNGNQELPQNEGCFIAVLGDRALEPQPAAFVVQRSILESLSYAHAATCSGLSGLESLDDPYVAQGFGAYKRLYADLATEGPARMEELAGLVRTWAERRRHAAAFLRWAQPLLPEYDDALGLAAANFEQEAIQCLDPLSAELAEATSGQIPAGTRDLLWRGLSWYMKGMQLLEPIAFSMAGLDSSQCKLLHAPDEEPITEEDVSGILPMIGHHDPGIRRIAVRKLVGAPLNEVGVAMLVEALKDPDPVVQEGALAALEATRPRDVRTVLWDALQDARATELHGNGPFLRALVMALTRVREAEVPGLLAIVATQCVPGDCRPRAVPTWCAEGIVDLFGDASWPYLRLMLEAPCPYSREAAAVAVGRLGVEETQSELHAIAFRDSSVSVQCAALGALGRMGSDEAIHRLLELIDTRDAAVRIAAAAALIEVGAPAIPLVKDRLEGVDGELSRTLKAVISAIRAP